MSKLKKISSDRMLDLSEAIYEIFKNNDPAIGMRIFDISSYAEWTELLSHQRQNWLKITILIANAFADYDTSSNKADSKGNM